MSAVHAIDDNAYGARPLSPFSRTRPHDKHGRRPCRRRPGVQRARTAHHGGGGSTAMSSLRTPPFALLLLLMTAFHDALAAPDITMSIRGAAWPSTSAVGGGVGVADGNGPNSLTVNQVHTLISSIEFRLRDLSNTIRRDQQAERINSRIDLLFNKLNSLEVSNGMWFDKFQQSVVEECGQNHMTRRLDKAQQQQEITLEHMEITLETVQNHQKELEKEMKKVADRQTELFAEIQYMRKDMSSEFVKHNSSQNDFRKQLQETVTNLSQQSKMTEKSSSPCSCNQNDDPSQMPDTMTTAKLVITVNNMYNGLKERSDDMRVVLKELLETIGSHQRKLDSDRHMINEFADTGFLETIVGDIAAIQKKSENEFESKLKKPLQLLVDGQKYLMDNCHRLQLNERQIENDMIIILERIFDHIDNKSTFDSTTLEQISKTLNTQSNLEEKMFGELSELSKTQADQITRTVAYSTNQVIKLHQDVMNISDTLKAIKYIAPNGLDPNNTTNVSSGVHVSIQNTTQNSNPLTTKNRSTTEKSLASVPIDKLSNRGKPIIVP